jgi:hypothetical protein
MEFRGAVVKITAPANGASLSGTLSIVTQVFPSVTWINISIDGGYFTSLPLFTFSWNSATVANGVHNISTRASVAAVRNLALILSQFPWPTSQLEM